MSQTDPQKTTDDEKPAGGGEEEKQEKTDADTDQRPPAWAARRDLIEHSPRDLAGGLVHGSRGGELIHGSQYGLTGGEVHGNVNIQVGTYGAYAEPQPLSGEIPANTLAQLSLVFAEGPRFADALSRLRDDHFVILSGGIATGRRAAALMLLHRLGLGHIRSLAPETSPASVRDHLETSAGYLLADIMVSRTRPLQETHLLAIREQLVSSHSHLVITVAESSAPRDVDHVAWEPPCAREVLEAHVLSHAGVAGWERVRDLAPVRTFLSRDHTPVEATDFARHLVAVAQGTTPEEQLTSLSEETTQAQIESWLTGDTTHLRDKAFLISLSVFDQAPYALAAELGDRLFTLLNRTENPGSPEGVPVFGSSRQTRLNLARARGYQSTETTAWGSVDQYMAAFKDRKIPARLLDTAWLLYPSARPALVSWLRDLAADGRPLVRTRASAAAAVLTKSDLSSGLAHLVEPWAGGKKYGSRLAAANTLTLAHLLETPAIPEILHDWCVGEDENRRWTAIRAYGLLGPVLREKAMKALITATREYSRNEGRQKDRVDREEGEENEELLELVEAVQLLLLAARGPVLTELSELVGSDHAVRGPLLGAFLLACAQVGDDARARPLILEWYRDALDENPTEAHELTGLWRTALNDRQHTDQALKTMGEWIRFAERSPDVEGALSVLLSDLAQDPAECARLGHLLRTVSRADGGPVAERLLVAVPGASLPQGAPR
ncbi:hypothetical protein [Streptomyces sp. NBC_01508]|uniref:hypothetical protein n=1 Tax=Streptomyces sp. NBC_01508 TaxID=2903888 RepID=UPI00386895BE